MRIRPLRPDLLALAALALLALLFFWPVTLGRGWIPSGGGDLVSFLWPNYSYAAQAVHVGRLPLWNPSLHMGAPFAADNESGLFYPINLLTFLLFPRLPYAVMEWLVVLHFWVAGAGMYWLMRVLLAMEDRAASARGPALFAAVAFMFSDLFVTHIGNLNLNAVPAWLPAVLAAQHLALTRRSAAWSVGAGLLFALSTLAGHAQMTYIVATGVALHAAWHIAWAGRGGARLAALTGLTFGIAFGLAALAIVPGAELASMSTRARLDYATASAYSIPWAGLAGLISPVVFGRGPGNFWGPWNRVELGYLGVLPLLLAGLAPFRDRRGTPVFLAVLGALALAIALGSSTPVHRLLYESVPGFAQMRVPARFIVLTDLALAALAGYGLRDLAHVSARRKWLWAAFVLVLGVTVIWLGYHSAASAAGIDRVRVLWLSLVVSAGLLTIGVLLLWRVWPRAPRMASILAVVVLSGDLIGHGAWVEVDRTDPTLGFQHSTAIDYLRARPGPVRMDNASAAWAPSAAARFGLEDIGGTNHALVLAAPETYLGAVGSRGTPLYNFLNAQYVIADKGRPPADSSFVPVFDEDPGVDIYLNTGAMARVSLVYAATFVSSGEEAFGAIHAPGFDPAASVVVEGVPGPARLEEFPSSGSNLYYLSYAPEAFTVVAVTTSPAYVVFSEVWYPGWRAWVDGEEVTIFRANFAFRGVYVPAAGEHSILMRFDPPTWKLGLAITLLTAVSLAAWAAVSLSRRARARQGALLG